MFKIILAFTLFMSQAFAWDQSKSVQIRGDVASGLSTGPNYWKSGDAETADAAAMKVSVYNDGAVAKPIDCDGGSSSMSVGRDTTNALYDKYSWSIHKPASNAQGSGIAFEFDVDNGVAAVEMLDVLFDYIVTLGTFNAGSSTTNSDLMVYLYDVTDGKLIEPQGGSKLYTSSTDVKGSYQGWFQSTLASKKYRVCLHQATTSAAEYYLKVDAGKVQKSKYVVGNANNTFTASFSVAGTLIPGSNGGIDWINDCTLGTTTNYGFICTFKSGHFTSTPVCTLGSSINESATQQFGFTTKTSSGFTLRSASNNRFGFDISCTKTGADYIRDVQISDGYDGRPVITEARLSANQTISSTAETTLAFATAQTDTVAAFVLASNAVRIVSSGYYDLKASIQHNGDLSDTVVTLRIKQNSSTTLSSFRVGQDANSITMFTGKEGIYLSSGDLITATIQSAADASYTLANNINTFLSVKKNSGTPFMSPTAKVIADYTNTAGTSVGTSYTLIPFATRVKDSFGLWNGSRFNVAEPGDYTVQSSLVITDTNNPTNGRFVAVVYKNGSFYRTIGRTNGTGASVAAVVNGTITVSDCVSGDYIEIYALSTVATSLTTSPGNNFLTIKKDK